MYWTDSGTDKIQRSNLDGSGVENLFTTERWGSPRGIALDFVPVAAGKDLVVRASVSDYTLTPGQSFTLSATARNQGTEQTAATTLRFFRSDDETVDNNDTQIATAAVNSLTSVATSAHSVDLMAPARKGTYFYGACLDAAQGESDTGNNCSAAVSITVVVVTAPGTEGANKLYWTEKAKDKAFQPRRQRCRRPRHHRIKVAIWHRVGCVRRQDVLDGCAHGQDTAFQP